MMRGQFVSRNAQQLNKGLVRHWSCDAATISGGIMSDLSGSGDSVTLTGSPTQGSGKISGGLTFDGSTQYGIASVDFYPTTNGFTVAAWVNLPSAATYTSNKSAVAKYDTASSKRVFQLYVDSATTKYGFITSSTGLFQSGNNVLSAASYKDGSWHHVCATYETSVNRISIDGASSNTVTRSNNGFYSTALATGIANAIDSGVPLAATRLNASLDDIRIYARTLASTEITALYNMV